MKLRHHAGYVTSCNYQVGPTGTNWDQVGPSGTKWDQVGPSGTNWDQNSKFWKFEICTDAVWCEFVRYGAVWREFQY